MVHYHLRCSRHIPLCSQTAYLKACRLYQHFPMTPVHCCLSFAVLLHQVILSNTACEITGKIQRRNYIYFTNYWHIFIYFLEVGSDLYLFPIFYNIIISSIYTFSQCTNKQIIHLKIVNKSDKSIHNHDIAFFFLYIAHITTSY